MKVQWKEICHIQSVLEYLIHSEYNKNLKSKVIASQCIIVAGNSVKLYFPVILMKVYINRKLGSEDSPSNNLCIIKMRDKTKLLTFLCQ